MALGKAIARIQNPAGFSIEHQLGVLVRICRATPGNGAAGRDMVGNRPAGPMADPLMVMNTGKGRGRKGGERQTGWQEGGQPRKQHFHGTRSSLHARHPTDSVTAPPPNHVTKLCWVQGSRSESTLFCGHLRMVNDFRAP